MNEQERIRKLSEWFTKTLGFRVEVGPALEGGTVNSTHSSVMLVTHSTPRKYRFVPGNELEAITSAGADAVRLIDQLKAELTTGTPGHLKEDPNG